MNIRALNHGKILANSSGEGWRIYVLVFVVFAASSVIVLRLFSIQVQGHETYSLIAEDQRKFFQELIPERGEVYLGNGEEIYPLAVNQDLQMAYMVPKEVEDVNLTVHAISSALSLEEDLVRNKLEDREDLYEILKHKLSEDEVNKIRELGLPGIHLISESFRLYPSGELASHVVGFIGSDGQAVSGRYGIEAFWEQELRGEKGQVYQEGDSRGRWISIADRDIKKARNGDDLVLSIDYTVQYETEKVLKDTVEKHEAERGSAIVMDPKTGRILAMASYPNFNPNEFGKVEDMTLFANPSVSLTYECGSVFKPITMAAGIDDGKVEPDTTYVDTGQVQEAGYTIKNSEEKVYGKQTMTQVLEESLNTGAIFVEKELGNKKFSEYVKRFGFGERTGIDLPSELSGNISNLENFNRDINFFTASFGQGIAVTPLQLVNAYAAIANGGNLMKPQIIEKIVHDDGNVEEVEPVVLRRVLKEETAEKMSRMLRSVVVNGHGKRADVPGYLVGGKTGTAQVAKSESKGYEEGITIGSFAGFAPTDDPQFVVLVKIDDPKDVQWAESTAAPAFSKIMKAALEHYRIEPTEEYDLEQLDRNEVIEEEVVEEIDNKKEE